MNIQDYQQESSRTDLKDYSPVNERVQPLTPLLHAGMGMVTEAGEFMDALKKSLMYGKELDRVNLAEELGDLAWYLALAANHLNINLEDVLQTNIDKLKKRYPEKFTEHHAIHRDLDAERKILANVNS